MKGPRVLHVLTTKGKGFSFAEANREKWHGLAAYDPETGEARKKPSGSPTWTQVFGDERLTAALLDRLTHHAHIVELLGESYRFRQRARQEQA